MGRARRIIVGVATVLAIATVGLVLRGAAPGWEDARGVVPEFLGGDDRSKAAGFSAAAAQTRKVPRGHSLIAAAERRSIRVHRRPRSRRSGSRRLRARVFEGQRIPLRFMVLARRKGWVRVQLPKRPNRSSGWVRRRDVRLTTTPYRIVIDRARNRLTLLKRGRFAKRVQIALGTSTTPTPKGRYFVTDVIRSRDPFYGPYALGLSAYSPVLTSYAGGDGQLGIHGTNQPGSIGRDVSAGCIRVDNRVIRRLAKLVPLGTPVVIR